jgi:hypothetical protein
VDQAAVGRCGAEGVSIYQPRQRSTQANSHFRRYMFPPTFRKKMAEMWHLPEIHHWWLPNDEGFSSLLREIRGFSEQRTSQQIDQSSEKLRDISAIFSGLDVERPQEASLSRRGS